MADGCLTDISDGQTSDIRPGPPSCGSTKGGGWIRREEADSADEENKPVYIDDIGNTTEWSPIDIDNAISAQPEPVKEVKPQPLEKKPAKTAIKEAMQKLEPDYDISIKVPD